MNRLSRVDAAGARALAWLLPAGRRTGPRRVRCRRDWPG